MKPKETAKQLVETFGLAFGESYGYEFEKAKKCAIISAELMIREFEKRFPPASHTACVYADNYAYWFNVKTEIEKIKL